MRIGWEAMREGQWGQRGEGGGGPRKKWRVRGWGRGVLWGVGEVSGEVRGKGEGGGTLLVDADVDEILMAWLRCISIRRIAAT